MFVKKSISRIFSILFVIGFILVVTPLHAVHAAGECYVKWNAGGTNSGTSWTDAYTDLQSALGASPCTEIWVAAGTYTPTTGADRSATFQLKNGVALYGGFAGTETARTGRNPVSNVTILSGDIDNNDSQKPIITNLTTVTGNTTNSYHVVTGVTGATLDGFTITAGDSDGGSCPGDACGAGMYNTSSNPTLTNLIFSGNSAYYGGGGMFNNSSSPTVKSVTFSHNFGGQAAGGMGNWYSSSPTLTNVTFSSNSATSYGGGMNNTYGTPTLTNVTFSNNSAQYGGAMVNYSNSPTIRNTIFWGNTATSDGAQIYNMSGSTPNVSYSVVQGGFAGGTNIITTDPLLGTLGDYGGFTQTIPLLAGSSAINAGNSTYCTTGSDQRGVSYVSTCDIGAFEYAGIDYISVRYTKPTASGSGDCSSWANACTLQTALTGAAYGQEIWSEAGTYKPTTVGTTRSATFQLKNGVALYGGFAGTETARTQRDPAANLTILSGDIDNNDTQMPIITNLTTVSGNTTNSIHVVTGATGATLDGFSITAGYADGGGCPGTGCGAGMYNSNSSNPTLTNITFSGNLAGWGGGMANDSSSPTLTNITFSGNSTSQAGGGMYNNASSSLILTNVTFSNNSSSLYAGGMFNYDSSAILTNVTFTNNSATSYGGGMANRNSSPALTNVTFSGNSSGGTGGGIWGVTNSNPTIRNTIFGGNTATAGAQIYDWDGSSSPIVSDSVVQDGYVGGTNIIITDPKLGTLGNYGGSTQTIPLLAGSSAIDTGNNATCAATDQRGVVRPQGAHCDIGAYEV